MPSSWVVVVVAAAAFAEATILLGSREVLNLQYPLGQDSSPNHRCRCHRLHLLQARRMIHPLLDGTLRTVHC